MALELALQLCLSAMVVRLLYDCDTGYELVLRAVGASPGRLRSQHREEEAEALRALESFVAPYAHLGVRFEPILRRWDLAEYVPQVVRDHRADLVALGMRPLEGLGQRIIPCLAERMLDAVACDVLVARARIPGRAGHAERPHGSH